MGEWPARAITIGSIVLTVASLTVAVLFAREATGSVVAFAVDPAQPDLLAQVNEALGAMADDGTYQQIYDRWFEDGAGSVAAPQT